MSSLSRRLLFLYLLVVVILAALGSHNQALHAERVSLMALKTQREAERLDLRGRATMITGPMAVRAWALEQGMIPAAQLGETSAVMKLEPPVRTEAQMGLEIRTIWR